MIGAAFLHASCYVESSVTSPFQVDVISRSLLSPLYAARRRESHKLSKYAAKALVDRRRLRVAVVESKGGFWSFSARYSPTSIRCGHTIMLARTRQQHMERLRSARESSCIFFSLPASFSTSYTPSPVAWFFSLSFCLICGFAHRATTKHPLENPYTPGEQLRAPVTGWAAQSGHAEKRGEVPRNTHKHMLE